MKSDNEVMLVQLVEANDHKLTGRIEINTIDTDATVRGKTASLKGSVSGNDLILQPESIWVGGMQASGTYSSSGLKLTGQGFNLIADRSSLDGYLSALTQLKSLAAERHAKLTQINADLKQKQSRMQVERDATASIATIRAATEDIRNDTARLSNGINKSPDFASMATANTARVSRMLAAASNMTEVQRSQLSVEANQVMVETNQIEIARSQYSIRLNAVVNDAEEAAAPITKLCGGTPASQFAPACHEAVTVMNDFKASVERGKSSYAPQGRRIADEMRKQEQLTAKIDG